MLTLKDFWEVYEKHKEDFEAEVKSYVIGGKQFDFNAQKALMGVINLSPDSWLIHSICFNTEQAIRRGKMLAAQGASFIDLGPEATSSNTARADIDQQKSVLVPVVKGLSEAGVLTSIETYYPEVARACLEAGANMINYTGSKDKEEMYRVVADFDAALICCYVQGDHARDVGDFDFSPVKEDPIKFVYNYFEKEIELVTKLGVNKLFIDPAVALGYTNFYYKYEFVGTRVGYQVRSLLNVFRLRKLGFPVFQSLPTPLEVFAEEVRSSHVFSSVFAILGQTDLIRTHEVAKVQAVLELMSLI